MLVKMGSSSPNRDEIKKYLKPPPSTVYTVHLYTWTASTTKFPETIAKTHVSKVFREEGVAG